MCASIGLLAAVVTCPPAISQELTDRIREVSALTEPQIARLLAEGELTQQYRDGASARLAPAERTEILAALEVLDPAVGVEVLLLEPIQAPTEAIDLEMYNVLRSISTMEGIEYYSASRDRMRTLFHESFVIAGPSDRTEVPDPLVSSVPTTSVIHIYQHDSSFARNVYEVKYEVDKGSVWVWMNNLTTLFYRGIVPAVGAGNLQVHLVVKNLGDHLLFYGNCGVSPISLLGMQERAATSFYNRLVAMGRWFTNQLLTGG